MIRVNNLTADVSAASVNTSGAYSGPLLTFNFVNVGSDGCGRAVNFTVADVVEPLPSLWRIQLICCGNLSAGSNSHARFFLWNRN